MNKLKGGACFKWPYIRKEDGMTKVYFKEWSWSSQADRIQLQLEQEVSLRRQLEKVNLELKDQLASVKSTSYKKEQLEKRKKQLDEEVLDAFMKCFMEFNKFHLLACIVLLCEDGP